MVDMPTLSRSMLRVGRVASDLLRRLSLPPALAGRDATPTLMASNSAHAHRLSHQDRLSRYIKKSVIAGPIVAGGVADMVGMAVVALRTELGAVEEGDT
nr:unnamed protein product [Digitaria exilis]